MFALQEIKVASSKKFVWGAIFLLMGVLIFLDMRYSDSYNVKILEKVFPLLEKYQVTDFENQDWTKSLKLMNRKMTYHGSYQAPIYTFDQESSSILKEITDVLKQTPVSEVYKISDIQYKDGKVEQAVFAFRNGIHLDGYNYVYDQTPKTFPDLFFEEIMEDKTIDKNWSFVRTD